MNRLLWICLFYHAIAFSQPRRLAFVPEASGRILTLQDTFAVGDSDKAVLETLRFYVSGIRLCQDDSLVWAEPQSFHLYDLENTEAFQLDLPTPLVFNRIRFFVGIDSLTNVSGAMGGALDPTNGMYWTWQSGYINMKLEGRSLSSKHPRKEFQLHLGGYETPYCTLQQVELEVRGMQSTIDVYLDVEQLLKAANLARRSHIMSPCEEAVALSAMMPACFSTQKP